MGGWDQNVLYGDWLGECGVDLSGCCEHGDEPSCSGAMDLVYLVSTVSTM
jgi:hypothetical protein